MPQCREVGRLGHHMGLVARYGMRPFAALAIALLLAACGSKSPEVTPEEAEAWRACSYDCSVEPSRSDLADRVADWAQGRALSDVEATLGSGDVPFQGQARFDGCPACIVYAIRVRGFGHDYLVLRVSEGVVSQTSTQWRRFN